MHEHEPFMRRALDLARRGRFSVSPNPLVGCVIVRDGDVIAEGFHRRAGEGHAEIEALRNCEDPRGATMLVTLEPCAHQGRTAPCTDAIVSAGISRVVYATADPLHGGADKLRAAEIEVVAGVLEDEARRVNEKFLHATIHHRPFVLLKAAMTFDGKLATVARDSQWITSQEARQTSLALREEYDAILVGGGTVAADNPHLTRRLGWNTSRGGWTRVVLDRAGIVPATAHVLTDGGETLHIREDANLEQLLADLYQRGVQSLLVEGGSMVHSEFIRRALWQKLIVFVAPLIVGGAAAPSIFSGDGIARLTDAYRFRFDRVEAVGPDLMITAYPS